MDYLFGRRHAPYYPPYPGGFGAGRAPVLELLVPMCCEKCEEKVYEEMMDLRGVQGVLVDRPAQRVIVHGFVDPHRALRKARKVKRDSQIWSGETYGRDFFSSPKYRRSAHRFPSLFRTSSLEYQPSLYRTSSYEYRHPSVYRSSYNQYTPSYGTGYGMSSYGPRPLSYEMDQAWSAYDNMYSPVVTNPYYMKHPESEFY